MEFIPLIASWSGAAAARAFVSDEIAKRQRFENCGVTTGGLFLVNQDGQ
jgi:hypothetical protein